MEEFKNEKRANLDSASWLDGNDSLPAPCRLSDQLKQLAKNGMDFEVVSYTNENRINSDGRDVEYSTALLRVYDV